MAKKIRTPFHPSANPTCLLQTSEVKNVIGRTKFAIDSRAGLTGIFGDVGLGKTSIVRYIYMDYLAQEDARVAMIATPVYPYPYGFLRAVCDEFKVKGEQSLREQLKSFQAFVTTQNREERTVILIIDEAQKLKQGVLEFLRTLLNFERPDEKLLQIVLAAQLELRDRLCEEENDALYSRLYTPSLLNPLAPAETLEMIEFRCESFGIKNPFSEEAMRRVHALTGGVPRRIVGLCGPAYEVMLRLKRKSIGVEIVEDVFKQGNLKAHKGGTKEVLSAVA